MQQCKVNSSLNDRRNLFELRIQYSGLIVEYYTMTSRKQNIKNSYSHSLSLSFREKEFFVK